METAERDPNPWSHLDRWLVASPPLAVDDDEPAPPPEPDPEPPPVPVA